MSGEIIVNANQYDAIEGIEFIYPSGAERILARPFAERYTLEKVVGSLNGQSLLDLACGHGEYTRFFRDLGASELVGVDISEKLLSVAKQIELTSDKSDEITPITYLLHNAAEMPKIGNFDVVAATHLLHYAENIDELNKMCLGMSNNIKSGGKLYVLGANPEYNPRGPVLDKYGYRMHIPPHVKDGQEIFLEVKLDEPILIQGYHWSAETREKLLREAGFTNIQWHHMQVSPEGLAKYGEAFWQEYLSNPHDVLMSADRI
ncbi:class I SAM-dependent methyltransferase [Streptomyces sp. NPDC048508]|uniref:class I SAM-dependent methyltransferase n=1 Tax=Streptomyces sp. NPDC048508 TaxID=3365561 RepID=UPI003710E833